ncbi:MAG: hypothetical protein ABSH49_14325 [Bryobacteraceae bacterium]|jgi:hypothetical protein
MFLFDLFRSFLPLHNPLGFGVSDFLLLALAMLLAVCAIGFARLQPLALRLASHTRWSMLVAAALPVLLRLALLPRFPAPSPAGADDFAYLLLADTLRHLRLANPVHPLHLFFEAVFVLQEPSYSAIFPPGQGLALAVGWAILGHPWAGVVLSVAAFCALCYWMLRAWTTPGWALVGGLLAAAEFGPLNQWMNLYWGGAVGAVAGCLVFGALPRIRGAGRKRDAAVLGAGLGLALLTRPFEFLLLAACVLFYAVWYLRRERRRWVPWSAGAFAPAVLLMLAQNYAVTGSFATMPYQLSRYQYGVPATFTFQPNPTPERALTAEQALDYRAQSLVHDEAAATPLAERLAERAHFYRFFLYPVLVLALPAFLFALREFRFAWAAGCVVVFAIGTGFYPYFYPHYIAALTCLFVLIAVTALERLSRWTIRGQAVGAEAARLVAFLSAAHFLFWYGIHCGSQPLLMVAGRYDTDDFIDYGDPEGRLRIASELAGQPGKQLVFVRYSKQHQFHEWIHNAADIDAADVVWANDFGPEADRALRAYYPNRTVWLCEPDAKPPLLALYR